MALPIILVDSATGSDTAASGAGPATALTGSAASTSGTGLVVTLDGSPDLSGVATDGSHCLFLNDATAGKRNFGKITAVDNTAKTVTVSNAFGLSLTGKAWAVGGRRASIGSTTSKKLFDNNGTAGDAMPGWAVELQSGHSETLAAALNFRRAGDGTDGPVVLRGAAGAAVLPLLTFSNNGTALSIAGVAGVEVQNLELRNTNATKTASVAFTFTGANQLAQFVGLKVSHATDKFWKGFSTAQGQANIQDCEIGYCASHGIENTNTAYGFFLANNDIHDCGGAGVSWGGSHTAGGVLWGNLISNCAGQGIVLTGHASITNATSLAASPNLTIVANTVVNSGSDGVRVTGAGGFFGLIANNILSGNGGYGINFSAAPDAALRLPGGYIRNNAFFNNTSGATNPASLANNLGAAAADPQFTNAAGGDFSVGANLKALGYPTANVGAGRATRSYVDIGAAQRQEPAGGGGGLTFVRRRGLVAHL